ncbi:40S ribosomal protein S29 [Striga asiatica]|uniref:40S ribosomal protein S29 n=1 Tax=Striga asiatica TaxID=4170 RepID=A0A5A7PVV7_STRAF|nr:40S ribosomal protein S29 [Striga asiatica]
MGHTNIWNTHPKTYGPEVETLHKPFQIKKPNASLSSTACSSPHLDHESDPLFSPLPDQILDKILLDIIKPLTLPIPARPKSLSFESPLLPRRKAASSPLRARSSSAEATASQSSSVFVVVERELPFRSLMAFGRSGVELPEDEAAAAVRTCSKNRT